MPSQTCAKQGWGLATRRGGGVVVTCRPHLALSRGVVGVEALGEAAGVGLRVAHASKRTHVSVGARVQVIALRHKAVAAIVAGQQGGEWRHCRRVVVGVADLALVVHIGRVHWGGIKHRVAEQEEGRGNSGEYYTSCVWMGDWERYYPWS